MKKKLYIILSIFVMICTFVIPYTLLSYATSGWTPVYYDYRGALSDNPCKEIPRWDDPIDPPNSTDLDDFIEGWYFDANCSNDKKIEFRKSNFKDAGIGEKESYVIFAKFKPVKLIYDYLGVCENSSITQEYTSNITAPEENPNIEGWYFDRQCTKKVDFSKSLGDFSAPYGNISIYAKWKTNIVYHYGDGMEDETKPYAIYSPPENEFITGWYIDKELTQPYNFNMPMSSYQPQIDIYPKWDSNKISQTVSTETYNYIDFTSEGKTTSSKKNLKKIDANNMPTNWTDKVFVNTNLITPDWYVVTENVTIDSRINVNGNVKLLLLNGCTLTAPKSIVVSPGNSLTIYAQSEDINEMGAIVAHSWGSQQNKTDYTAAIGGTSWGYGKGFGNITFNGGKITAIGSDTAGIGSGYQGKFCGAITFNGGYITAQGHGGSAGIGLSYAPANRDEGGSININGGTIYAVGGNYGSIPSAAIGKSAKGHNTTVNINKNLTVFTGHTDVLNNITDPNDFKTRISSDKYALITDGTGITLHTVTFNCNGADKINPINTYNGGKLSSQQITLEGATISDTTWYKDANFTEPWDFVNNTVSGDITLYAKWVIPHIEIDSGCENQGHKKYWMYCGKYYSDEEYTKEIKNIEAWLAPGGEGYIPPLGHDINDETKICKRCGGRMFVDENGKTTAKTDCILLTTDMTELEDGKWYYINDSLTFNEELSINGNVHIIISDGKTLTANNCISVPEGSSLAILSQSIGLNMGTVNAKGRRHFPAIGGETCGNIIINGCIINAEGGACAPAIGSPFKDSQGTIKIKYENVLIKAGDEKTIEPINTEKYMDDHSSHFTNISFFKREPLIFEDSDKYNLASSYDGSKIKPIDFSKAISGGLPTYTFTATDLPSGLSISKDGVLSGKFNKVGTSGTATISVTDIDNNIASITINYESILPINTAILKIKKGKNGSFKVIWGRSKYTGYQLRYSLKSNMKAAKEINITKNSVVSKTVKKLKKGKVFYVQIRTYQISNGKKYFSVWSKIKKVKV